MVLRLYPRRPQIHMPHTRRGWLEALGVVVGSAAIALSCAYLAGVWPEDQQMFGGWSRRLEHVRNAGLVIGGVLALMLAYWRSRTADRQVETERAGQRSERFHRSAESLGHESMVVRHGAVFALQRLVDDDPHTYYVEVVKLLCAFVRTPGDGIAQDAAEIPVEYSREMRKEAVETIVDWLGSHRRIDLEQEDSPEFVPDFSRANLEHLQLRSGCKLSGVVFSNANLSNALLLGTDLSNADLTATNLAGAQLGGANLMEADLRDADISGSVFYVLSGANFATGLRSDQIRSAVWNDANPPRLEGLRDEVTGEPLSDVVSR